MHLAQFGGYKKGRPGPCLKQGKFGNHHQINKMKVHTSLDAENKYI